jgi:hypothetical protein
VPVAAAAVDRGDTFGCAGTDGEASSVCDTDSAMDSDVVDDATVDFVDDAMDSDDAGNSTVDFDATVRSLFGESGPHVDIRCVEQVFLNEAEL